MRVLRKKWFRIASLTTLALLVISSTLFGLSFRVSLRTDEGFVSVGVKRNVAQAAIVVTPLGTAINNKASSTLTFYLTGGVVTGDWYLVAYAGDTALIINSAYTRLRYAAGVQDALVEDIKATNNGNVVSSILSVKASQTVAWDGTYPYINLGNTNLDVKTMTAYKVTGLADTPFDGFSSGTGSGTTASTGSTGLLAQDDELVIGATGVEDEIDDAHGTWTTGAGYVSGNEQFDATNDGGDASNIQVHSVARIVSDGTSQAYQGVDAGHDSTDWAAAIATYKMAAGGTPDISVSPTSYGFGVVAVSSTPSTATNYFTITNNSTIQTDQTISVTTSSWSGGVTWTHSDTATAGVNTAGMKANRGGTWGVGDVIVKNGSPNYIYENCPASTGYSFGLKLIAPTEHTDGVQKQIIVRVSAVAG